MFDAVVYFKQGHQTITCCECKEFTVDISDLFTDDKYDKLWEHAKTHEPKSRYLSIEILDDRKGFNDNRLDAGQTEKGT